MKHLLRTMLLIATLLANGTDIWADEWSIDFAAIGANYDDKTGVSISSTVATINGTTVGTCSVGEEGYALDSHFVLQTGTTWLMRKSDGLYQGNGGNRAMGMLGCTQGQLITIVGTGDPNPVYNATLKQQDGNAYTYTVTADGDVLFSPARYLYFTSLSVSNPPSNVVEYTVQFLNAKGEELKAAVTHTAEPGSNAVVLASDTEAFLANDQKYLYEGDDSKGKTIAADGTTVIKVYFREANVYTYYYDAAENANGWVLRNGIASGSCFELDVITFPYCKYILSGGTLYTREAENKEYRHTVTVTNNINTAFWYTDSGIKDVVYYSEGENIPGATIYIGSNTVVRSSNAATGISADGQLTLTTLQPGTYQIVSCVYTNSSGTYTFPYLAGENTVFEQTLDLIAGTNATETTSEEFTIYEPTTIYLGQVERGGCGVDYVYIVQTGELETPDAPFIQLTGINGTQRTYTITNNNEDGGTIYYTTSLSDTQPAMGSVAWSTSTGKSVSVTVDGLGYIYAYVSKSNIASEVVGRYVTNKVVTLNKPNADKYFDSNRGAWWVRFYSWLNYEDYDFSPAVSYRIDGGAWKTYQPNMARSKKMMERRRSASARHADKEDPDPIEEPEEGIYVEPGQLLEYYAAAEGFTSSETTSVTATEQFDGTYSGWLNLYGNGDVITLGEESEVVPGWYYMWRGKTQIDQRLLVANENIDENFISTNNGIISAQDRIYTLTGMQEGSMIHIETYDGTAVGNAIAIDGLTYDAWLSNYDTGGEWHNQAFRVTSTTGTVQFKVSGGCYLSYIDIYTLQLPYPPYIYVAVEGAKRIVEISKQGNSGTLYYTTELADEMPALDSSAWSSTNDWSVQLTFEEGQGNLYAYVKNSLGSSDVISRAIECVELTANTPYIYNKWYSSDTGLWTVNLNVSNSVGDSYAGHTIYYSIDGGEETAYSKQFTMATGQTLSFYAKADNYKDSPVTTVTAAEDISSNLTYKWGDSFYVYSEATITLGEEMEPGLFQMLANGATFGNGSVLTPNENINDNFRLLSYGSGIASAEERTYALQNMQMGQYLYVYVNGVIPAIVTPVQNLEADIWNSRLNYGMTLFKVTGDGTVKFTVNPNNSFSSLEVYQEREDGYVDVADANGNVLQYYYETATGPAALTRITSYASDETKAGRIIIADEVTDAKGHVHEVKYINGYVENRYNLKSITFGANITCVGGKQGSSRQSFYNCTELESVTVNAKLDTIGQYAFGYCSALKSINLGDATSLRAINSNAFYYCTSLKDITINSDLTTFGSSVFYGCDSVETVSFNGPSVPASFLTGRSLLKTINIGKNVKSIGNNAFQNNYKVNALNIAPEVSDLAIGTYAFQNLDSLRTVSLPAGVKQLGNYCFNYCDSLQTVALDPASTLTALPEYCFQYCYGLRTFFVPKSVETIGQYCFSGCTKLQTVTFDEASPITAIPTRCFNNCSALETITLPDAVETVGNYAFYNAQNLREITFGTALATGGFYNSYYVFYGCKNVEKMTIKSINFPFQCNMSYLPDAMMLFVDPDMVNTYKTNSYTKRFHIMAIGSQTDFAITTTAGGQVGTLIPGETAANVLTLKITGPINGTDINQLHETMPFLEVLDLKDASIVEGGEDYYRYSFSNNKATKSSYHWQTQNDVVGQYMFYYMPNLKRFIMPDGVTRIEQYGVASYDTGTSYTKLAYVELPSALTSIGDYAFQNTAQMTQADIPASVTSIGECAFWASGITQVVIPNAVTAIAGSTFYNCQKLKTVTLPDGITTIGNSAFYYCTALESINMPQSVQTIGNNAFYYCYSLTSPMAFPATLTSIGYSAFSGCSHLPSVTFSEGLTSIGNNAFSSCNRLPEVVLPQSLTSLGTSAFYDVDSLKTFTFPANIKKVPSSVLANCDALQSVTLAEGTTEIGSYAFQNCPKLAEITNLNQATLTTLGSYAFQSTGFTSITLPESITSMGTYVLSSCSNLESANIPSQLTTVPGNTFYYCQKLTSVSLPSGITQIDSYAFYYCKQLPTIALGDQITSIGYQAFYQCENLAISSLPASLKTIGGYAFAYTYKLGASLTLPETLTTLDYEAFRNSGIKGVTITKPISNFSTNVFNHCDSLESVVLPKEMTVIPEGTFQYTPKLKSITLPDSLKTIGYNAFYESGLETVSLPAKVQTIQNQAFYESQLREIDLPLKLETIGSYAFYGTQLREIRVPKNVTSVGEQFAGDCRHLKAAYLGRKQDYTANYDFDYFYNCDSLELLRVYAGTPPNISSWTSTSWDYNAQAYRPTGYAPYRTNCVLEVPEGQVDIYKATDVWKEFKEIRAFESEEWLNDADFAVLKKLYNLADGANWAKTWNLDNKRHANGKWQGVSTEVDAEDDELFYITAIDLNGNGLKGTLPKDLFQLERMTQLNLSHNTLEAQVDTLAETENSVLTTLNLEGNHLRGDLSKLVKQLPALTSLNVAYNWLTAYSEATPNTVLTNGNMSRGFQFVDWQTKQVVVPEDLASEVIIDFTPGTPIDITSNTLQTYRHEYGDWGLNISSLYRIYNYDYMYTTSEGALTKSSGLWDAYTGYVFKAAKGQPAAYTSGDPYWSYITHIIRVDWEAGDVNGDQDVDVLDVQNVVYYALNDSRPISNPFYNYTAADANSDNNINVSDIIGTVGLVLSYEQPSGARARIDNNVDGSDRNLMSIAGSSVLLEHADEVAALQLTISGATRAQLSLATALKGEFSMTTRDVDGGVKVVIYSPMGNTLSPGQSQLLTGLPAGAAITDARLSDVEAQPLGVTISDSGTTGIDSLGLDAMALDYIYDLSGRRMGRWNTLPRGVYIIQVNGKQYKVKK